MKIKIKEFESLECRDIELFYGKRHIFSIPKFSLQRGERILVQGPSGSGKSSFLKMLGGILLPTKGNLEYFRQDGKYSYALPYFLEFRRHNISMTFAEPLFFESLSVRENILFPHIFAGLPYRIEWMDELIATLDLQHILSSSVYSLSSGERDRVNIVRALLYETPFLFLDEPGSHLDSLLFSKFLSLLSKHMENTHPTTVIVSHSPEFAALIPSIYICQKQSLELK